MSVRDELVKACEAGDAATVDRLGWSPVYEAASTWWAPRQKITLREFTHYAKALGDEPPEIVLEAFKATAGEWRPTVGALIGAIRQRHATAAPGASGDRTARSPHTTPEALAAVRAAVADGKQSCSCGSPTAITWIPDGLETRIDRKTGKPFKIPLGAWRCPRCGGLEQGQVFALEDCEGVA